MSVTEPRLEIGRFRLLFAGPRSEADFAGNHWRGALGHALRASACLSGAPSCEGCPLRQRCEYAYLFETPAPPEAAKMRRYTEVPHPYVLRELPAAPAGADVALEFTLLGRAVGRHALVCAALARAAQQPPGIGGRSLRLLDIQHAPADATPPDQAAWQPLAQGTLPRVEPAPWPAPPPAGTRLRIRLLTPLRVKHEGRPVPPAEFRFADLFGVLLRRLSMLTAFHTDAPLETDFRGLMDTARALPAQADLQWVDLQRHSARQRASMKLGGVVGTLALPAEADLAPFWPCLWLGQFTHAGAATSMGLGCLRLETEAAA